jgi:hypothetical protein
VAGQVTTWTRADRLAALAIIVAILGVMVGVIVQVYGTDIRCALGPTPCGTIPPSAAPIPTVGPATPQTPTPASEAIPSAATLTMDQFTSACVEQYGDAQAVAMVAPTDQEPPSYWIKCFVGGNNLGGLSLDDYCPNYQPGTQSYNPERYGPETETSKPWLKWQCIPG